MSQKLEANLILIALVWIGVFVYWAAYEIRHDRAFPSVAINTFLVFPACILTLGYIFLRLIF